MEQKHFYAAYDCLCNFLQVLEFTTIQMVSLDMKVNGEGESNMVGVTHQV